MKKSVIVPKRPHRKIKVEKQQVNFTGYIDTVSWTSSINGLMDIKVSLFKGGSLLINNATEDCYYKLKTLADKKLKLTIAEDVS